MCMRSRSGGSLCVVPGRFDLEPFRTVDVDGSACARYNGQGNGKNPRLCDRSVVPAPLRTP